MVGSVAEFCGGKVKVKIILGQAMRAWKGSTGIVLLFL